MNRDEFEARYRLLQTALRSGGAITHHALSPEGAVVMVHVFDGDPADVARLEAGVAVAVSHGDRRILERLEVDGHTVLVTRFILDFSGLEPWLPPAPADAPSPPKAVPPSTRDERPGEFTRAFESPSPPASPRPPAEAAPEPPAPPAETAGPPAADADSARWGGEFTRMFHADEVPPADSGTPPSVESAPPPAEAPPPPPSEPSAPAPPPPVASDAPGEFTQLFRAPIPPVPAPAADPLPPTPAADPPPPTPAADSPPPVADPPAAPEGPGEFTRQFGVVDPAGSTSSSPGPTAPPPASPPPPAPSHPPQSVTPSTPPPPPPPASNEPGEFTRQFGAFDPVQPSGPADTSPPPPAATPDEPGEFTRQFGAFDPTPPSPTGGRSGSVSPPNPPVSPSHGSTDVPSPRYGAGAPPTPSYGTPASAGAPEPDYGGGSPPPPRPADELPEPRYVREESPPPMATPPPATPSEVGGLPQYGATEDYAERLHGSPPAPRGPRVPAEPPPPAPPPASTGPGEYTRIINSMHVPPVAPSEPEPAPPVAEPEPEVVDDTSKRTTMIFVIALVLIVLTAIALLIGVALAG